MNIYVGNLSLTVTEAELRSEFIPFGTVTSVTLMNDAHFGSGQPRGYGYIEMPCIAEGELAISVMNGKHFGGRVINLVQAMPMSSEEIKGRRNPRERIRN
jgi:RNA recognition motif-containing protein